MHAVGTISIVAMAAFMDAKRYDPDDEKNDNQLKHESPPREFSRSLGDLGAVCKAEKAGMHTLSTKAIKHGAFQPFSS